MLHLDDASTCKKHDLNTNMKINRILKTFLHKYNKCFTESVQKYLNEKSFKASNFSVLPKTHKSKKVEAALYSQKTEVLEIREPGDLKQKPTFGGVNCRARRSWILFYSHI